MKCILIIAGSDSCGGAGIQADIKAAYKLRYHAATVISAITAQNSTSVVDIMPVDEDFIFKQLKAVLDDIVPDAVKIGMLFSAKAISVVLEFLKKYNLHPVVLDPIVKASTGASLLEEDGIDSLKRLFLAADVITPNSWEAAFFTDMNINSIDDMKRAAISLYKTGAKNIVITGFSKEKEIFDLIYDGKQFSYIKDIKASYLHTHGSGCVYSTSLSIFLAEGYPLKDAALLAHNFTKEAILKGYPMGKGSGPVFP